MMSWNWWDEYNSARKAFHSTYIEDSNIIESQKMYVGESLADMFIKYAFEQRSSPLMNGMQFILNLYKR